MWISSRHWFLFLHTPIGRSGNSPWIEIREHNFSRFWNERSTADDSAAKNFKTKKNFRSCSVDEKEINVDFNDDLQAAIVCHIYESYLWLIKWILVSTPLFTVTFGILCPVYWGYFCQKHEPCHMMQQWATANDFKNSVIKNYWYNLIFLWLYWKPWEIFDTGRICITEKLGFQKFEIQIRGYTDALWN